MAQCERSGLAPRYIDCGGGIDAAANTTTALADLSARAAEAAGRLPSLRAVWVENGRYLTRSSTALIVCVLDIKERPECRYLICDGGRTNHALDADNGVHNILVVPERSGTPISVANGKVRGVLTALRVASHEAIVIADDDVRHTPESLAALANALANADIVRPQNYFSPLPWHARVDTARTLINRMTGGDWPGTLAVRRSVLQRTGGYDGNVLFENLELVRTVVAAGGRFVSLDSLFVRRLPPKTQHFWNQRIRQAYDEFARPIRLVVALSVMPVLLAVVLFRGAATAMALLTVAPIVVAELGRRRSAGRQVFPVSASLCAPLWIVERATCAWLAVASRVIVGGVRYHGRVLATAAHSRRALERAYAVVTSRAPESSGLVNGVVDGEVRRP